MLDFDNKSLILDLDKNYRISIDSYNRLQEFIVSKFNCLGKVSLDILGSYNNSSIKFHVGDEYCIFGVNHNSLDIRRIYIPEDKRGNGFLKDLLECLEKELVNFGINSIVFEAVLNPDLFEYLNKEGYSTAYFNNPKPNDELAFAIPDVYKILK